jgi:hypothetical protein
MTYVTADVTRTWVHQSGGIKAKATQSMMGTDACLFMPYESAKAYAFAINSINDREAVDADENANANS